MHIKNVVIKIIQGDITSLRVDGIVCTANMALTMEQGLAAAVRTRGGVKIEAELGQKGPILIGEAIWTTAGMLDADYVIHAATSDEDFKTDEAVIRQACRGALQCAAQLKVRTLAFPAMGCGAAGFPVQAAAKIMAQEVMKFIKLEVNNLKEVIFCLWDRETFRAFEQTASGYIHHIQDTLGEGPYVTVDAIIEFQGGVILIERSNPPYGWALPGGFVNYGESVETAVRREVKEETNLELQALQQFHVYSEPDRDPRFHTVSTVFIAQGQGLPKAGDDAKSLTIVPFDALLKIGYAFDHKRVIEDYLMYREKP